MLLPSLMLAALIAVQPTPPPSTDGNLPEIGRVRALTPACTALHDVVLPAAQAARRADGRFLDIANKLPDYAKSVVQDPEGRTSPILQMKLSRLDQTSSLIVDDLHTIAKLLDDPRIAATVPDPLVQRERDALVRIYNAEMTRVSNLREFVVRQDVANGRAQIDKLQANSGVPTPTPTPFPYSSLPPDDLPQLTGFDLRDAQALRDWSTQLTTLVRRNEVDAVQALTPIAAACQ